MLIAAMRLNIPAVFVSGGPMEAGRIDGKDYDLVDVMVQGADESVSEENLTKLETQACPTCGCCSGMFTANSMNCLTEALGLALPGNGTVLATHINRKKLFQKAAKLIVKNTKDYYFNGNEMVLPRSIAMKPAFMNAMSLDIAMGGSTNTVLHLLAVAHEAGVDFTLKDTDALSRKIPVLCKVAPNGRYHIQDVNRAGGIMRIMGELHRNGFIDAGVARVDYPTLEEALAENDIMSEKVTFESLQRYISAPGRVRNLNLGSQEMYYKSTDKDPITGCIRDTAHAYSKEGGLAVLYGNLAVNGCIVKTAGVDSSILKFEGPARVYESQEEAADGILGGEVEAGNVVVIRYEGPKGGPGMQEMLYPTSYLKSVKLDKLCALVTDGRFSGGTSGLSIGHISPEAAAGGNIALIENGDRIIIDIPARKINIDLAEEILELRREKMVKKGKEAFKPLRRERTISNALKVYAAMVSSADKGGVRIVE